MLHYFCAFALLIAQVTSMARFFVGKFQGTYLWAYPFDMCVPSGVLGYPPIWLSCSPDGMTVTKNVYKTTDPTCAGTASSTSMYTSASMLSNGAYYFVCNGSNDYLATELYVGSCTSPIVTTTVYNAINTCYRAQHTNTSYDYFQDTQCWADKAVVSTYAYSSYFETCDTYFAQLLAESIINTSCTYYLTNAGETVYAQLSDCVYDDYSQLLMTANNSVSVTPVQEIFLSVLMIPATMSMPDPDLCGQDWYLWLTTFFDGSFVSVTTLCSSEGGNYETYQRLWLAVYVQAADYYPPCTILEVELAVYFALNGVTNVNYTNGSCVETNLTTTATPMTTAPAPMQAAGLIVFAVSLLATLLM